MTSTTGQYDQSLLASAPEVTGARRQEGYTTDLLNANSGKTTPPFTTQSDLESGLVAKEYNQQPAARPIIFWRTKKGMIIIFVAGIVILGAVIGGAVGGTAGKKDSKDSKGAPQEAPQGPPPGVGTQGAGSSNSTTSGPDTGAAPNNTTNSNPTTPSGGLPNSPATDGGDKGHTRRGLTGKTLFDELIVDAERAGIVEYV